MWAGIPRDVYYTLMTVLQTLLAYYTGSVFFWALALVSWVALASWFVRR